MSNSFLFDLAKAHQNHEGFYPGSRSYRNNNPGNLRAGAPYDVDRFTIFKTYAAGFAALQADLRIKICGGSKHIDYSKDPKFIDYIHVYAPADDGNNPQGYCQKLCIQLSKYNVKPSTPLTVLAAMINQMIDRVPDPQPTRTLQQELDSAQNALRWAGPERERMLQRKIERILHWIALGLS